MTTQTERERLAEIKTQLAEKYEHLATLAGSQTKRKQFRTRAAKHRRQATELRR